MNSLATQTPDWKRLFDALITVDDYPKKELDMQHCVTLACKAVDQKEYQQLLERARARYDREVAAISLIWKADQPEGMPPKLPSTAEMIRQALPRFGDEPFTVVDVRGVIEELFPDMKGRVRITTLSGTFTRMAKRSDSIKVHQRGSGTIGTTYIRLPEIKGTM